MRAARWWATAQVIYLDYCLCHLLWCEVFVHNQRGWGSLERGPVHIVQRLGGANADSDSDSDAWVLHRFVPSGGLLFAFVAYCPSATAPPPLLIETCWSLDHRGKSTPPLATLNTNVPGALGAFAVNTRSTCGKCFVHVCRSSPVFSLAAVFHGPATCSIKNHRVSPRDQRYFVFIMGELPIVVSHAPTVLNSQPTVFFLSSLTLGLL